MGTDVETRLVNAMLAALAASAALQTACGRSTELVVQWRPIDDSVPLPILLYQVIDMGQTGEEGDSRDAVVQFTAIAQGNDALETCQTILQAIEQDLTALALLANGIDATPWLLRRLAVVDEDREQTRAVQRRDMEVQIKLAA